MLPELLVIGQNKKQKLSFLPLDPPAFIGYNTRMNSSLSIFARALATENLSFSFDPTAETASFDVKQRHLIMPVWKVSETVQTMLIAHEISHALWTPYEESEAILAEAEKQGYNKMLLQRIANVVEDVRIEKLMKEKYPGTRRDFFLGYKEIIDTDLFGFSKMDIPNATLVNRLNLHFKWGAPGFMDVPFSADEQQFVDMIDSVETFAEVYEVAMRLYDHPSMQSVRQQMEQQKAGGSQQDGEGKKVLGDGVTDFMDGIGKKDGEVYNCPTITIPVIKNLDSIIIKTDVILQQFEDYNKGNPLDLSNYRKFVKDSDAFVRQLASQFDRRKAADEIRRERPKQTGMLNLDRLHQYRTHDDLFISKIVKQDGKNHGIVFLLDFSGSMSQRMSDTLLQVLQLVWFCEKAQIPFEVFGFTDVHPSSLIGYDDFCRRREAFYKTAKPNQQFEETFNTETMNPKPTSVEYGLCRLLNLASSRDSAANRERLLAYIYESMISDNRTVGTPGCLSLHGTPTVEAAAAASQFMQEWVKQQNIQIPTFMLVTDGSPNGVYVRDPQISGHNYYCPNQGILTVVNEIYGTAHRLNMGDENIGQNLPNLTISTILDSMRTKLNARIVGMFVAGNSLHMNEFIPFCLSNKEKASLNDMLYNERDTISDSPRYKAAQEAYKEGAFVAHPDAFPGFDSFFVCKTPKIVKDEDAIAESGTFTKIKNTFIKTMAKRSVSRVFLTRYVDIVAGQKIPNGNAGQNALPWHTKVNKK